MRFIAATKHRISSVKSGERLCTGAAHTDTVSISAKEQKARDIFRFLLPLLHGTPVTTLVPGGVESANRALMLLGFPEHAPSEEKHADAEKQE
jgi:hypothetical protein